MRSSSLPQCEKVGRKRLRSDVSLSFTNATLSFREPFAENYETNVICEVGGGWGHVAYFVA